jgi:hypothetical protein
LVRTVLRGAVPAKIIRHQPFNLKAGKLSIPNPSVETSTQSSDPDSIQKLAVAHTNEAAAHEASTKAAAAVRAALAARDALINDAGAGKPVQAQDVRAAEEAARAAEIDAEIAARVHSAALMLREKAQVVRWHDEAAEVQAAMDAAAHARTKAGADVDQAIGTVRGLLELHQAASNHLRATVFKATNFNRDREARRANNTALRNHIAIAGPDDPLVRGLPNVSPMPLEVFLYPAIGRNEYTNPIVSVKAL